jgi:hypothetical protein
MQFKADFKKVSQTIVEMRKKYPELSEAMDIDEVCIGR